MRPIRLRDALHALARPVHRAHLLKRPAAVLRAPPRVPRELRAALRRALLARDEHAHTEDVRGDLADHRVRGRAAREHEPLQRGRVGGHNRPDAGADGEELRLENGARVGGGGHLRGQ